MLEILLTLIRAVGCLSLVSKTCTFQVLAPIAKEYFRCLIYFLQSPIESSVKSAVCQHVQQIAVYLCGFAPLAKKMLKALLGMCVYLCVCVGVGNEYPHTLL